MALVDSHCHLDDPVFDVDFDAVIQRAKAQDISHIMTVSTDLKQAPRLMEITQQYPFIFTTMGIHPHHAQDYYPMPDLKDQLRTLCRHSKVVGIGETGLDYYYNNSPKEAQIEVFKTHLQLSLELDLPVIIHTRDAEADTLEVIRRYPGVKGVFHCFSGSKELAMQALELGFYISFSGIITFKKADELREICAYVPLDRLLVETDAPYLAPIPHRGRRNEPAHTRLTAEKVSEIKEVSFEKIAHHTTANYFILFSRAQSIIV